MKASYIFILLQINVFICAQPLPIVSCVSSSENMNPNYSKAKKLQQVLDDLVKSGIPGCAIAIYTPEGWWASSAGFAKIEDHTPMQVCHLQHLQSIAKTYTAATILKLAEEGRIDLHQPITTYLPSKFSKYIRTPEQVTVKMLLNHTSGIPEYGFSPAYITALLQQPKHHHIAKEYLQYVGQKTLDFVPGSKYTYCNTNYVLLSLIGDAITGDHARYMRETIFNQLELSQTYYRGSEGYLNYPTLVNSYWDRHSDGVVENVSFLQNSNVASLVGDDGIVTTPMEAVKFLKALMEGKIISMTSLEKMKSWVTDERGNPIYGLGLDYAIFAGHVAYGHSGGGIGAGSQLYYFPDKDIYIFAGINLGTITESPLHVEASKVVDELYRVLLE